MANVLILEDDPDFGSLMRVSLEQAGHFIVMCGTATDALAAYEEYRIDIVVTDLIIKEDNRPIPDGGLILISRLKAVNQYSGRKVPIIAISGQLLALGMEHALDTARTVGADVALRKPFAPEELLATIDTLLGTEKAT